MKKTLCLCIITLTTVNFNLFAQTTSITTDNLVRIATVNIVDLIGEVSERNIKADFSIANREGLQNDIRYGVKVIKKFNDTEREVYTYVHPESFTLNENSSSRKKISFALPPELYGEIRVVLEVKNSSGLLLAVSTIKEITLKENDLRNVKYPLIKNETCYLTVGNSKKNSKKLGITDGVDLLQEEYLVSHCEVVNPSNVSITFGVSFATFARSLYGEAVTVLEDVQHQKYTLLPNEKKIIETKIPHSKVPQSYSVLMKYGEGTPLRIHYVIKGGSGTLQNVVLDKSMYNIGDTAKISFFWSPSADDFEDGSRFTPTELTKVQAKVSMVDEKENLCQEVITNVLTNHICHF